MIICFAIWIDTIVPLNISAVDSVGRRNLDWIFLNGFLFNSLEQTVSLLSLSIYLSRESP